MCVCVCVFEGCAVSAGEKRHRGSEWWQVTRKRERERERERKEDVSSPSRAGDSCNRRRRRPDENWPGRPTSTWSILKRGRGGVLPPPLSSRRRCCCCCYCCFHYCLFGGDDVDYFGLGSAKAAGCRCGRVRRLQLSRSALSLGPSSRPSGWISQIGIVVSHKWD